MDSRNGKLSFGSKLGYGIASFSDSIYYSVVVVFLVYFLTVVAKIEPGIAGTISSAALLISAFVTLLIGHFSDNSKHKGGRRRHFIKAALPVLFISFIAVFTTFGFTGTAAVIYYAIFIILFWCGYCGFFVPYTALGAEMTDDYNERTSLRSYSAVSIQIGGFVATACPLFFVSVMMNQGLSQQSSWTVSAVIFSVMSGIAILIMIIATRGKERIITKEEEKENKNIVKNYIEVFRAKPTKFIVIAFLIFIVINGIFTSNLTFFAVYNLGLTESAASTIYGIQFLFGACLAPVINLLAHKTDKRRAFMIIFLVAAALICVFSLIGIDSYIMLLLLAVAFIIANAGFWQLAASTMYDVAEVIELNTGQRLEGTVSSLQSFIIQIGGSLATLILGWSLQLSGFDEGAAVQSDQALSAIVSLGTIVPVIGCLIIVGFMALFPINKKTYGLMQNALKDKNEKGTFSKEGLQRILK